jgi:PD-(D/E)XK endonuclease
MRRPRPAPSGRIPASEESPARKAASRRGHLIRYHGDLGESAFLHKATSLGFMVARPWRNIYCYDFIVEGGRNLWRVQVKTTTSMKNGLYKINLSRIDNRVSRPYAESEIDFVAAYVMPEETWYVLPVREVVGHEGIGFRPKGFRRLDIWAPYREAWHLLRQPDGLVFG